MRLIAIVVKAIGNHPFADRGGEGFQDAPGRLVPSGTETQPLQRNKCVASPVQKPGKARQDRRGRLIADGALGDKLPGRQKQMTTEGVVRIAGGQQFPLAKTKRVNDHVNIHRVQPNRRSLFGQRRP